MKTGIVLEIKNGKATILKSDGTFVSMKADNGWQKGDTVPVAGKRLPVRLISSLAACVMLVLLAGGYGYRISAAQVSVISMDVNPSIEIRLNRFDRVVSYQALNREGEEILGKEALKYQHYQEALEELLKSELAEGYFDRGASLVFTVYTEDEEKERILLEGVRAVTDRSSILDASEPGVEYYAINGETLEEAHGCGVTAGKYLYLQKLQEADPQIDITQYCHNSIDQLKGQIKRCNEGGHRQNGSGQNGHDQGGHGNGRHSSGH